MIKSYIIENLGDLVPGFGVLCNDCFKELEVICTWKWHNLTEITYSNINESVDNINKTSEESGNKQQSQRRKGQKKKKCEIEMMT